MILTLTIYRKRIKERSEGKVTALSFNGLHSIAQHRCKTHGVFDKVAVRVLYAAHPCPKCSIENRAAKQVVAKEATNAAKVAKLVAVIKRNRALVLEQDVSTLTKVTQRVTYTCLGCGSKGNPLSLNQAANNSHGCRTCTNKATNALKIRPPKTLLLELRAKYPGVTILGVARKPGDSGTKNAKIKFECTTCATLVTRSLWPFVNPVAIHKCASCTAHHVATVSTSGQLRTFRHLKSGKAFKVRGSYEPLAIRILVREGIKVSALKPAQDIKPVEYHFLGKDRLYLPDIQYRDTIVEVKSDYTAGLKTESNGFAMLKAKAKAVERSGLTFRLMLFKSTGKGKPPCLVEVPENWLRMSRSAMVRFFESA